MLTIVASRLALTAATSPGEASRLVAAILTSASLNGGVSAGVGGGVSEELPAERQAYVLVNEARVSDRQLAATVYFQRGALGMC